MVYVDLPPEGEAGSMPVAPSRAGRAPLGARRAWRRDRVLQQLVDPLPIVESAGLLEQQSNDIRNAFKPRNGWQDWLTDTIATILLRINRSERVERKLRDLASYRAFDFWEEDQTLAVATVAGKLAKEPAKVVAKLRETPAGIDWLLGRWRLLAVVEPPAWTDAQRALAIGLVGGHEGINPAAPGFVAGRIDELALFRERVVDADAILRGLVEADLHDDGVPGLAQLRRYVRSLHRQLKGTSTSSTSTMPTAGMTPGGGPPAKGRRAKSGAPGTTTTSRGRLNQLTSSPPTRPRAPKWRPKTTKRSHFGPKWRPKTTKRSHFWANPTRKVVKRSHFRTLGPPPRSRSTRRCSSPTTRPSRGGIMADR